MGEIENNALEVVPGDILTFTNEKCIGTKEKIYLSYPNLAGDVRVGNVIMIDDGKIEVIVRDIVRNGDVKVEVTLGGILLPDLVVVVLDLAGMGLLLVGRALVLCHA